MSNQNPMEPTDDKEMIAQMTQFSTLEQITNMATESSKSATASQMSQAVNLLGRTVTYLDTDGNKQTGTVDQVSMVNGAPNLTSAATTASSPRRSRRSGDQGFPRVSRTRPSPPPAVLDHMDGSCHTPTKE